MEKKYLNYETMKTYDDRIKEYITTSINNLEISDVNGLQEALDSKVDAPPKTYGVSIDLSNSNPETAVTYTDDAVGMTAGSADWDSTDIFKDIKPCLFKGGAVVGYLKPNNFAQFEDGTSADITSGNAGDVMIEIPKMGYKINTSGATLTVQVTMEDKAEGFSYLAHTRQTEGDRDKLYIGAFVGNIMSNKLRSLSSKTPSTYNTSNITNFRPIAQAVGTGYDLFAFYQFTLIQCLYLIKYKNLNSQSAIGMGYVKDTTSGQTAGVATTGNTIDSGMDFGSSSPDIQMKFLGLEDLWGNVFCHIDGVKLDSSRNILTATDNYGADESYTDTGDNAPSGTYGAYIAKPIGNNASGFIVSTTGASTTTYFSDSTTTESGTTAFNGGDYYGMPANRMNGAGIFNLEFYGGGSTPPWSIFGARLMYL